MSIPKWICRHARNPGPIHPYGLPPVRDSQQFSSRFQRQITIPPTVNSIRPEAPSKGISRKGRNTSDDSGGAVHHRTSKDTCTGILPQTNLSVCRIYLLYLIIEHRNIAGEAYPAMSNAWFQPVKGEARGTMAASIPEEARGKGSKAYRCRRRSFNLKPT